LSSGLKILWTPELRERFAKFLRSKRRPAGEERIRTIVRFLDRYMPPEGISRPEEIFDTFVRCPKSTRHHLDRAFRNLLNFYERVLGYPREFINRLREAIPTPRVRSDKWVPGEELVVQSLRMMKRAGQEWARLGYGSTFRSSLFSGGLHRDSNAECP